MAGRAWLAAVERDHVRALRNFYLDGIFRTLGGVILRDLEAKSSGLDPNGGVGLGIEVGGRPKTSVAIWYSFSDEPG